MKLRSWYATMWYTPTWWYATMWYTRRILFVEHMLNSLYFVSFYTKSYTKWFGNRVESVSQVIQFSWFSTVNENDVLMQINMIAEYVLQNIHIYLRSMTNWGLDGIENRQNVVNREKSREHLDQRYNNLASDFNMLKLSLFK